MPQATKEISYKCDQVSLKETGFFGKIILDYLEDKESLGSMYGRRPALSSFSDQLQAKQEQYENREVLVAALKEQYKGSGLPTDQVERLSSNMAFTITTGHQVCLNTGPLYFLYKIISAVKTCESLKTEHSNYDFVPVFWMATEDHDFEEANHFYVGEKKMEWESGQGGAVGRMKTVGMDDVLNELKDIIGVGYTSATILEMFEKAYVKSENIAIATRKLVHQLFGKYGVVVVDGDDRALKRLVAPYFKREILEGIGKAEVEKASKELAEKYKAQVYPRDINLFYLDEEYRGRIEKKGEIYQVLNSQLEFSEEELLNLLEEEPEKFSPNVVLRPFYQEVILPNLAYIGGGGELAYWFQLKGIFDTFEIEFPILLLRNSVGILEKQAFEDLKSLGLKLKVLFHHTEHLEEMLLQLENSSNYDLETAFTSIKAVFDRVETQLASIDPTLEHSVKSGWARVSRILLNLEKKGKRAEKRKYSDTIAKFERAQSQFLPAGSLQERRFNLIYGYQVFGEGFIDVLYDVIQPFSDQFLILRED